MLLNATEHNGVTSLTISRKRNTSDLQDVVIQVSNQNKANKSLTIASTQSTLLRNALRSYREQNTKDMMPFQQYRSDSGKK